MKLKEKKKSFWIKLGRQDNRQFFYDAKRLYAESPSGAKGPARAVALLDNMYDAYQFKWNRIKNKCKFQKNI
jgi:hypothetical protein